MFIRKLYIGLLLVLSSIVGYGQTTTIDFETAGEGYTPSSTFGTGNTDVFNRTNTPINGNSTYHWAAEDISGNPNITLDQINISGSTSFTFSIDLSYENAAAWDSTDEMIITYSLDGGSSQNLLSVQHVNNDAFNEPAALDLDFDGNGDVGQELSTTTFTTFTTSSISLSANSTLDIVLQFNTLTSNGEGILIDNIVITEVGGTPTPTITVSPATITGLDYSEDLGPSAEQTFTVEGSNLTDNITITPPANFEISTGTGGSFVATNPITLAQSGGTVSSTTIYVRLAAGLSDGTYGASNITAASTGATTQNISVTGDVIQPVITLSPATITGLDYVDGSGPSAEQTFTASGTNLSDNITLTAPTNFEISTTSGSGFGSTVTLSPTSETVASTTIYVRLITGLAIGTYGASNITASSNLATTQNVSVSGEVTAPVAGCGELFISEYMDGSSNEKYIEIYNPTGSSISLANYDIEIYSNGSTSASSTIGLSGTIAANDVFVLVNVSASTPLLAFADQTNGSLAFNGNDAIVLVKSSTDIDVVGTIGSASNFAQDIGLQRKNTVQNPTTTYDASEWNTLSQDDVSDLGSHTSDCAVATPTITTNIDTISGLNYSVGSGPSAEQSFTVEGTDLTSDILITAPTNFQISENSGSGFTNSITLSQSGGSVSTKTIYVIMSSGLAENTYTGDIDLTSTGATAKIVDLSGEVTCVSTHTILGFSPISGPAETEVIITGTNFTGTTTVDFNGVGATVTFVDSTTLIAEVPSGASTGVITVYNGTCGVDSATNFEVLIDNGCVGGTMPVGFTDLMFSGVYDDQTESCHYIELLNPTSTAIDLSNYTLGFDNNFTYPSAVPITGFTGLVSLSGIIAAESTFMVQVTTVSGGCTSCPTISPDYTFVGSVGLNVDDRLVLVEDYGTGSATAIDVWQNHSSELADTDYGVGYVFARDFGATAPSTTFSLSDWNSDGAEDCFGFAIASTPLPTIDTHPIDNSSCSSISFSVSATAGNGGALAYQWKYNDGVSAGWTSIISSSFAPGTVTGETSDNLTITGVGLDGYQFYCEVTEAGTCAVFSNAAQVSVESKVWDGTSWDGDTLPPTLNSIVTLNGNYNTTTNGDLLACSLTVNATFTLNVEDNSFVQVQSDVVVEGNIIVETHGSFVQINDASTFTLSGSGASSVNKTTSVLNHWYDYTHWSSPVEDDTVESALSLAPASRRFYFEAANFVDFDTEIGNTGTFTTGVSDDIDDNGDDWQYASGTMTPTIGYAATVYSSGFTVGTRNTTFNGAFNNGILQTPIVANSGGAYNDWNFIGNPYPSAISTANFFTDNALIGGEIFIWSNPSDYAPSGTESGNYNENFTNADYATLTVSGTNLAGGSGDIPDPYIPSGQGFWVEATAGGNAIFNNAMRETGNNTQFFKVSNEEPNRLWINLTSDNGVFNQLAVAYLDEATDGDDGKGYDVLRSASNGNAALVYSIIDGVDEMFCIQTKKSTSLTENEIIPLGLFTTIDSPTNYSFSIAQLKGNFLENNTIYLRDDLEGVIHNLSENNYEFTSDVGEFNNRFKIVFNNKPLSVQSEVLERSLLIVDQNNGNVLFKLSDGLLFKQIELYDLLGRRLYNFYPDNSNEEQYNLSALKSSIFIAKVLLTNNNSIVKKAIKK